MSEPHDCVGIDLGTTHCALARAPLPGPDESAASPTSVPLAQLVARGRADSLSLLPSFVYFPHESEGAASVPWGGETDRAVGTYARVRAAEVPGRVVSSAKSWLSHPTVDRRSPVLPLGAPVDVSKISPVQATVSVLEHLSGAFGAAQGGASLGEQEVVLTVPASFDAGARECTVEAARAAGIENLTLLEEPQAAFYAWLESSGESWRSQLSVGSVVLVVDAGGGTLDFAAILLTEEGGALAPKRIAVGQHILLGGDNMDLALAHVVRQKLDARGTSIDAWQLMALTHAARVAKETLLSPDAPASAGVVLPSRGSQLLGGSIRSELTREEVHQVIVEGFFPLVEASVQPRRRPRAGLRQQGLPYADDPAVTAHLAAFLREHAGAQGDDAALLAPTHVLFNGGVFRAAALRRRVMEALRAWLGAAGRPPARELTSADLDLAVARGAAYYGLVRRGRGVRVRGGTAQAYYVGIESPAPAVPGMDPPIVALCVASFGMEEGERLPIEGAELAVVVGESVTFRFFGSTVRRRDEVGRIVEAPERELEELPPIAITLPAEGRRVGDWVMVRLEVALTAIGTLELVAHPLEPLSEHESWKVELSVREQAGEG